MSQEKPTVSREFIHAVYCKNKTDYNDDAVIIKENLHCNGKVKPNVRIIYNYQKPFYITKKALQNHNDKKEFEYIENLDVFYSNQAQLAKRIFKQLNGFDSNRYIGLSDVAESPYVYGADISTPTLLAHEYRVKYPTIESKARLMVMDYEWDIVHGTNDIISGVVSCKEILHIAVDTNFLGTQSINADIAIQRLLDKYLGIELKERNITPKISLVDSPAEVVITLMRTAHQVKPDFLGFWNIKDDVEHMLSALAKANIDPAEVFSDPSLPKEYKFYTWRKDTPYKQKSNGEKTPKHISDLWHTFIIPASFQPICLMAVHRCVRGRDPLRSSYKLDAVLKDYTKTKKLKFDHIASNLTELAWHKAMQTYHKLEYMVYMTWDAPSVEILDEVTQDIALSVRPLLGYSELSKMKSNPGKLADDMYFTSLAKGRVLTTVSRDMSDDLDKLTYSIKGWIITLSSDLVHDIGCNLINEHPYQRTNITTHAYDVDVSGAYPTGEIILNCSKRTCIFETCGIIGLSLLEARAFGINLSSVKNNALELAKTAYGYPSLDDLLTKFIETEY